MTKEATQEGKPERRKPVRVLGMPTDKLAVTNQQADQHYVWVNDNGMTLDTFEEAGYVYVTKDDPERVRSSDMTGTAGAIDNRVSQIVSRNGQKQFLMRIHKDEWERQQALRDKDAMEPLEEVMNRQNEQQGTMYVKSSKMSSRYGKA